MSGQKSSSTVTSTNDRALLEQLEQRVLLSETPFPATTEMDWYGSTVEVFEGSWIVSFDDSVPQADAVARTANMLTEIGAIATEIRALGRYWATFQTTAPISENVAQYVEGMFPGVSNIEPNRVQHIALVPNDPDLSVTWQLENTGQNIPGSGPGTPGADISALEAWDTTTGSPNQIVAVIDTGVDLDHPDLAANIWTNPGEIAGNNIDDDGNGYIDDINGYDFWSLDSDPSDESGHGTGVAGTIAAVGNNGIGTVGVAWDVGILAMRVGTNSGLSTASIIAAHDYLTALREGGVNIVASNNSYGALVPDFFGDDGFDAEREAIERFVQSGATFVAAAGNDSNDNDAEFTAYPASYNIPGVIAVAASDNNDGLSGFSNYGATTVDLAAPGSQVYTTQNGGGYGFVNGTSFSSPIVAGAVALIKSVRPDATAVQIRQALIDGTDKLPSLEGRTVAGGRLNIAKTLQAVQIAGPIVTSVNPGPIIGGPVDEILVEFNKNVNQALLESFGIGAVSLVNSGGDDEIGNGNDITVAISTLTLSDDLREITITPSTPLGAEVYQLSIDADAVKDLAGNFLNGNSIEGIDELLNFEVVGTTAGGEPNDSIAQATKAFTFQASGKATVTGATIGDGVHANLDVDIYEIQIPIGGLITAQIDAKSLDSPSTLDSYLRLFDTGGNEIASNDQFNNTDSFLQFFVTVGGTYYLGVSGFPNTSYNPLAAGSGTSQSVGTYNLSVEVDLIENDVLNFGDALVAPKVIPDLTTITDTILIEDDRTVQDVNVFIDIEHTFMSDMTVRLRGPDGSVVTLVDKLGGNGSGYRGTFLDGSAVELIENAAPPFTGTFRPQGLLSSFTGRSAAGLWTLIIEDSQGLNEGKLNDWALEVTVQNDIFGPFELNDTLATAKPLDIVGAGGATRSATIGDGGYGFKDVDLFYFTADPGSSLSASLTSAGVLNSAMRLFDSAGNQLQLSNPAGTRDANIASFTFASGGTYYIGVSEAANVSYDPNFVESGPASNTTGAYNLSVSVTAGVSDSLVVLDGVMLDAGISSNGSFGTGGIGLSLNELEILQASFYGAIYNGVGFKNSSTAPAELPVAVTDQSDKGNGRAVTFADFDGLHIQRSISFTLLEGFLAIDVMLTNTLAEAMPDVSWMEAINPLFSGFEATDNDVDDVNPYVTATAAGTTLALAAPASETRAIATVVDPLLLVRDPQQILDLGVVDPDGNTSDGILALAYELGDLVPGQSVSMRYFVFTGDADSMVDPEALYTALNDGSGGGHLTDVPSTPAVDADGFALLPFRLYHPEGFANKRASTFIPIVNPNERDTRVIVIARYETGDRDELLFDGTVAAMSRDGITITTPELFDSDSQLVRKSTPYAIEIRSELPIGATLSHFDFGVTTGESFTSQTASTWSFPQATKGSDNADFIVFYNPTDQTIKVDTTFYPEGGGDPITLTQTLEAYRRGGWGLNFESALKQGTYGAVVNSSLPIVAAISSFDTSLGGGYGALGFPGAGALSGGVPEGQFGLNTDSESIPVLNSTTTDAQVEFTFLFENGSAVRRSITVVAESINSLDVGTLPNFPQGQSYSVVYNSNVPVSVSLPTQSFGELNGSAFSGEARGLWLFSDGFRPAGNSSQVTEYLRVFNPSDEAVLTEVTLLFLDGTTETIRETIETRRVADFDPHQIVPLAKQGSVQFYGVMVKAASPVVSYMGRSDNFFSGAFGTLGTPLGITDILA